jgi:hypothetical protein
MKFGGQEERWAAIVSKISPIPSNQLRIPKYDHE